MKLRYVSIALAGSVVLAACSDQASAPVAPNVAARGDVAAVAPNRRIVLFASPNSVPADFANRVATLGGTVERVHAGVGLAIVGGLTDAASTTLAGAPGVLKVQPDAEIVLDQPVAVADADMSELSDPSVTSQANPAAAARYPFQWNMRQIGANQAWAAGKLGSASVTVGILDTGIDYNVNDMNGLVDLSRSVSFVDSDNALATQWFPSRNQITDFHGHGTNVATQVSSKAFALAGVTSKTTLVGVKVLNGEGHGFLGDILSGIVWAADHNLDVINMSIGGAFSKSGKGEYIGGQYVSAITRTLNYAQQKGMLVVVAAGNEAEDLDQNGNVMNTYCGLPHVLCVSAVGPNKGTDVGTAAADAPAIFTNFGRSSIDVAGPGGNYQADADGKPIVSAGWPWGADIASWVWSYCPKDRIAKDADGKMIFNPTTHAPTLTACAAGNRLSGMVGTSQATPHVAGLAALLIAEKGVHGQPQLIKQAIMRSGDDLGQPGVDPYYGAGRINVAKALGL